MNKNDKLSEKQIKTLQSLSFWWASTFFESSEELLGTKLCWMFRFHFYLLGDKLWKNRFFFPPILKTRGYKHLHPILLIHLILSEGCATYQLLIITRILEYYFLNKWDTPLPLLLKLCAVNMVVNFRDSSCSTGNAGLVLFLLLPQITWFKSITASLTLLLTSPSFSASMPVPLSFCFPWKSNSSLLSVLVSPYWTAACHQMRSLSCEATSHADWVKELCSVAWATSRQWSWGKIHTGVYLLTWRADDTPDSEATPPSWRFTEATPPSARLTEVSQDTN